jgi:hypothetical protein
LIHINYVGVVDASGVPEVTTRENAVARMTDHGITAINWTTVAPSGGGSA